MQPSTRKDKKKTADLSRELFKGNDKRNIIKAVRKLNTFRKLYNSLCRKCKQHIIYVVQVEKRQPTKEDYCNYCKKKLGYK